MTDSEIVLAFQRAIGTPVLSALAVFSSRWLIYLSIPFAVAAYRIRAYRLVVIEAAWSVLVAFAVSSIISALVDRVRPFLAVKGVVALVPPNIQHGSFPSSHTAIAVAIAFACANGHPVLGGVLGTAAVCVAIGRIATGMHFPTDILGGVAVGMLAVLIVRAIRDGMGS